MINIVLADDHMIVRQAIRELLESSGKYNVIAQASNGKELLKILDSSTPDVIIMDIAMPEMTGIQAAEVLRKRDLSVPILALSANDDNHDIRAVLTAGANGFVPKNSGFEELEFAISSILRGNAYLSPSVTERMIANPSKPKETQVAAEKSETAMLVERLTKREKEIMRYLADGLNHKEIAATLKLSSRTIDTHRSNILKKLKCKNNAALVKIAIIEGIIDVE